MIWFFALFVQYFLIYLHVIDSTIMVGYLTHVGCSASVFYAFSQWSVSDG